MNRTWVAEWYWNHTRGTLKQVCNWNSALYQDSGSRPLHRRSIVQRQLSPVAKNSILSELHTIWHLLKILERSSVAFEFSLWDEQMRARPPSFRESATPQKNPRSSVVMETRLIPTFVGHQNHLTFNRDQIDTAVVQSSRDVCTHTLLRTDLDNS